MDYGWRLVCTGAAFLGLFFGGAILSVTVLPFLGRGVETRRRRSRKFIHYSFRFYIWVLKSWGLISLKVDSREELGASGGCLIVANHPTLLDVVLLISLVPSAQCIIKQDLLRHPLLGGIVRRAGFISNKLPAQEFVAACGESLARGDSVIIFPEGTRTRPREAMKLHRGFAHVATITGASLQLVLITCQPRTLMKGDPWWRIPSEKPLFRIRVGDRIAVAPVLADDERALAVRKLASSVETYFSGALADVGP